MKNSLTVYSKTLTSWTNIPLWRYGGVLSVEIKKEIKKKKTSCTGKRKELHSQLNRYEGMELFTCGGDKFEPEPFVIHTFDTKNRVRRGKK